MFNVLILTLIGILTYNKSISSYINQTMKPTVDTGDLNIFNYKKLYLLS